MWQNLNFLEIEIYHILLRGATHSSPFHAFTFLEDRMVLFYYESVGSLESDV